MADVTNRLRFAYAGVPASYLLGYIGQVTSLAVDPLAPRTMSDVTVVCDSSEYANRSTELMLVMADQGYTYVGENLPVVTPRSLLQVKSETVTSNLAAITGGGWTSVLSTTLVSRGASQLFVDGWLSATVVLGGGLRLRVAGGQFGAGTTIAGASLPILGGGSARVLGTRTVNATPSDTTYTVSLEAQSVGIGASVTLSALTNPDSQGATLLVYEAA